MISGNNKLIDVRKPIADDLSSIKQLADRYRNEIGFVLRPALVKSIVEQEIFAAFARDNLIGFIHYHHRRDLQTTLYHIAVASEQHLNGIGRKLIDNLYSEAKSRGQSNITLKCPIDLSANKFYERCGFMLTSVEPGKHRQLCVWLLKFN
jgi:ribosomal protein S18 acetylase RimI-like enzyme